METITDIRKRAESLYATLLRVSLDGRGLKKPADKAASFDRALQSVEEAVKVCGFVITLVDEHRDELEARDQLTRDLTAKLLAEGQELNSAKETISALQQQVASLQQQLLLSRPTAPPQQQQQPVAERSTSESCCQQHLEAALGELESLRGQLADVTIRQQQQVAATEAAVAEVAELRQLAAEVEPLRQRSEKAESATEALRLQTAAAEQQLRRQLEASRGQVAALQYEKLIAEKIVLERLYDALCAREQLDLQFVVGAVVATHDELGGLVEAARARQLRREQYRREAKMGGSSKVMRTAAWCR
ncbi:hypothetical protein PLESTM_000333700 [Pleodorina starrii]|nr:hypothetical protein PLESTM_000333700 [Pleodorina starrii]